MKRRRIPGERGNIVVCKYCGEGDLEWLPSPGNRWRLAGWQTGIAHDCKAFERARREAERPLLPAPESRAIRDIELHHKLSLIDSKPSPLNQGG